VGEAVEGQPIDSAWDVMLGKTASTQT